MKLYQAFILPIPCTSSLKYVPGYCIRIL